MIIELDRTGTASALAHLLESTANREGVASILVMACDANGFTPQVVDPLLQALKVPVFGGIFPEILHDREHLSTGTLVIGSTRGACVEVIPGLGDDEAEDLGKIIEKWLGR